ncbi:unnamed protein product [Penicillium salamii]|uniref:PNPLA domain-containing protein n=1 Tax=Penicillium salamii TaxID=1612424 RepID=A0A9W4JU12_9EURO|nr:unnamed protein product [Penicillium salamii]CAG8029719.1 unnamed protein product [Penicillium salamii]CAG8064717.1 unnamed protein product [Penicillium salamii]CAG8309009.1 unnamed protein product [Penicillium salamii]CAG8316062.1 unnamed protein product [Penicillium salamii]
MQHKEDIGWLDIGKQQNSRLAVVENRRLKDIISQLEKPEEQYPSLCAFIGGPFKDHALQKLYPWNNIRRHVSDYKVRLRYDVSSLGCRQPILFVDGDIIQKDRKSPLKQLGAGAGHPIFWECGSAQFLLLVLWARLVFLFTDVICIFIDDYPESSQILELLTTFSQGRSTDPMSSKILPRLILISGESQANNDSEPQGILVHRKLLEPGLTSVYEAFSEITTLRLGSYEVSDTGRYEPLRSLVGQELSSMRALRKKHLGQPNGKQLVDLFQAAFQHVLVDFESRFNLLQATRTVYKVSNQITPNVSHYLQICSTAGLDAAQIIPTIASAVLMDHYVPGMLRLDPCLVFRAFYRSAIVEAYRERANHWPDRQPEEQVGELEAQLLQLFESLTETNRTPVELRKNQLAAQSGWICRIRSNRICLYCLFQNAQHVLGCGHTLCDRCAHIFGTPSVGIEYEFTIRGCIYCLYQRPLIASVLPPTMSPSVLAIDGGGVRGVIPLEFLLLVHEHLHPCRIQDVVDLALGTSSGGLIVIGLSIMSWNIATCSEIFDNLARRIFHKRRRSPLALFNFVDQNGSVLGNLSKWIHWLLHDSCYDAKTFDDALKGVFGDNRLMFGSSRDDPRGSLRSNSKVGVVTTSISRETGAFVIGNFNTTGDREDKAGKVELRIPAKDSL